ECNPHPPVGGGAAAAAGWSCRGGNLPPVVITERACRVCTPVRTVITAISVCLLASPFGRGVMR
ncbi:MAG: hypothetical protein FWH14_08925, partial [Oscillospiraceae bacterium]|nr:hypothetical protein [Oscillospiraceae bacterium]